MSNDIYTFHFFRVTARIVWEVRGSTYQGETNNIQLFTEFNIRMPIKRLMIFDVQRTGLGWLKVLSLANTVDQAAMWLSKLPMIAKMIALINGPISDYCADKINLEDELRRIYETEKTLMECSHSNLCA